MAGVYCGVLESTLIKRKLAKRRESRREIDLRLHFQSIKHQFQHVDFSCCYCGLLDVIAYGWSIGLQFFLFFDFESPYILKQLLTQLFTVYYKKAIEIMWSLFFLIQESIKGE